MKYNDNGEIKNIVVKAADSLPIGTIIEYDGDSIPEGYEALPSNIGNILITSSNINPSISLGGTWEQLKNGYIDSTNLIIQSRISGNSYATEDNGVKLAPGKYKFFISNNEVLPYDSQYQLFVRNSSGTEKTHYTRYTREIAEFEIQNDAYTYIYIYINTDIKDVKLTLLNNNDDNVIYYWKRTD